MRVYLCGSHAVGKSSLARYVSKKYNLPLITECARMVLSERELSVDALRADIDIVDSYQSEVFKRQFLEEQKYKDFVADRSNIDTLAYSSQHSRIASIQFADPILKPYIDSIKAPSSFVFFVRPSKATLSEDGVREKIDWDGIIAIDAMVKLLLEMFEIRYFQINTSSFQERIRIIDSVLSLI
jgi:nicotinamide riboside kinase